VRHPLHPPPTLPPVLSPLHAHKGAHPFPTQTHPVHPEAPRPLSSPFGHDGSGEGLGCSDHGDSSVPSSPRPPAAPRPPSSPFRSHLVDTAAAAAAAGVHQLGRSAGVGPGPLPRRRDSDQHAGRAGLSVGPGAPSAGPTAAALTGAPPARLSEPRLLHGVGRRALPTRRRPAEWPGVGRERLGSRASTALYLVERGGREGGREEGGRERERNRERRCGAALRSPATLSLAADASAFRRLGEEETETIPMSTGGGSRM
jgi:hypothetical protein